MKYLIELLVVGSLLFAEREYSLIRLKNVSQQDVKQITTLGIDLEGSDIRIPEYLEFSASSDEIGLLESLGYTPEILIENLPDFYAARLTENYHRDFGFGSMGGFYTFDEVVQHLDELHDDHPDLVSSKIEIGSTYEGRPI